MASFERNGIQYSIGANGVPYYTRSFSGNALPSGYEQYLPRYYAGQADPNASQPINTIPIGTKPVFFKNYDLPARDMAAQNLKSPLQFLGSQGYAPYTDEELERIWAGREAKERDAKALEDKKHGFASYTPTIDYTKGNVTNEDYEATDQGWADVDNVIKNNLRVDYLPEGAQSFNYDWKFTPQIDPKSGVNQNSYMSNDAFKQYYELNKPFFDRADPNTSMQEHYANWLRNKDYLPEAYKEQPGFFGQLGQGLLDNFTSNPLGFAGGLFNLYQGFKQAGYMKDYYNTQKDLYNTQKNIMLNNERRNQEQWNMLKRQRASSSL